VKELTEGVCYEQVKERTLPTSAYAEKTFPKITTQPMMMKMVSLVMLDLKQKVTEIVEEHEHFPLTIQLSFKDRLDNDKRKTKRQKFVSYHQFLKDKNCATEVAKEMVEEHISQILPAWQVGVGVTKFVPVASFSPGKTSLNRYFCQVKSEEEHQLLQEREMRTLKKRPLNQITGGSEKELDSKRSLPVAPPKNMGILRFFKST